MIPPVSDNGVAFAVQVDPDLMPTTGAGRGFHQGEVFPAFDDLVFGLGRFALVLIDSHTPDPY